MATRTIAKGENSPPHPVLSLPFVADLPDPQNPRRTIRCFWNIPDHADYQEACDIGRRWGAAFVAYTRMHDSNLLAWIAREIAERESKLPPDSFSTGFKVGFFSAIEALAAKIGEVSPDYEERWLIGVETFYRKCREEMEAELAAEISARVARMNAGKAAKAKTRRAAHV